MVAIAPSLASRCALPAAQRPGTAINAAPAASTPRQPLAAHHCVSAVPSAQRPDAACARARGSPMKAFAIESDGSPIFGTAAEGAPAAEDGFGCELEVGSAREQAPQNEANFVHRLRTAAGEAAALAGQAAARLHTFTMRFATMVAKSIVLGVSAQLAHRQRLARLAAQQRERAQASMAAAAGARQAAHERLRAALAARSKADRAFVKMLLSQDNPARSLEDKWGDLCNAMRSDRAPKLRMRTAQLFSAALDSSHAVQQAIATEAAKGNKALDRLVSQHDCVKQEEALRAEIFAEILAGSH